MARVAVSPEISVWIAGRIAGFPSEAPKQLRWEESYVAEFSALPLHLGWFETIAIRPDGEIVRWSTEGEYPGVRPVEDRFYWLPALVDGSRRYTELAVLLPQRPAGAVDCLSCRPVFGEPGIICGDCLNLGWVVPGDE